MARSVECISKDTNLYLDIKSMPTLTKDGRLCIVYESRVEKIESQELVSREHGDTPETALYLLHKHYADRSRKR